MKDAMQTVDMPVFAFPTCTAGSVHTTQDIDCLGSRAMTIRFYRKANSSDTGAAASALRILHSDATGTSATGTLTASIGTVTPSIALTRSTATNMTPVRVELDLKGVKRFVRLEYTASTGTVSGGDVVMAIASLYRPEGGPTAATALCGTAFSTTPQVVILAGGASTTTSIT